MNCRKFADLEEKYSSPRQINHLFVFFLNPRVSWLQAYYFWFCDEQCSFVEHRNYKVVYRRYASLFFLVGVDNEEVSHTVS